MPLTPVEQWLLELERERTSRWIKNNEPEVQILKEVCTRPHESKKHRAERDRVFYDAGRFAAGDRDKAAIKANDRLHRSRKKEEKKD